MADQNFDIQDLMEKRKGIQLPGKRKMMLYVMAAMSSICLLLVIISTIYPVPVFKNSQGLLRVVAAYPNSTDHLNGGKVRFKRDHAHSVPLANFAMEKRTKVVTEYWDEGCACLLTVTKTIVETDRKTRTHHRTTTVDGHPTYHTSKASRSSLEQRKETRSYGTTTYTTTTATGYITPKPQTKTRTSTRATPAPSQTAISALDVNAGAFAGLFLGVTGGCLQRRSGVLVCTSTSFSPNFIELYEAAGLPANVTAQLPTGTGGASTGLLISIVFYCFTTLCYFMSLTPAAWIHGPSELGTGKMPDFRHEWSLVFATGSAAISTFTVVACCIQLQNTFGASAEAVEAWDISRTLSAELLTAYGYLYASAIMSGACVVICLSMIAWQFHSPKWLSALKRNELTLRNENQQQQQQQSRAGGGTDGAATSVSGIGFPQSQGMLQLPAGSMG